MTVPISEDRYPLALLADFELMPTGTGDGVMALCRRHDGEVSALVVNSVSAAPLLGSLAYMAAEHEAEHHNGPAMPDEGDTNSRPKAKPGGGVRVKHYQAYAFSLNVACGPANHEVSWDDKTTNPENVTCAGCKDEMRMQAIRDRMASAPNPPAVPGE